MCLPYSSHRMTLALDTIAHKISLCWYWRKISFVWAFFTSKFTIEAKLLWNMMMRGPYKKTLHLGFGSLKLVKCTNSSSKRTVTMTTSSKQNRVLMCVGVLFAFYKHTATYIFADFSSSSTAQNYESQLHIFTVTCR